MSSFDCSRNETPLTARRLPRLQPLRLTLEVDRRELMAAVVIRRPRLVEVGLIVAGAALTARIEAMSFWSACAAIALVYYSLAMVWIGASPQHGICGVRSRPLAPSSPGSRIRLV